MKPAEQLILTINGGSSSIKFALYRVEDPLKRGLYGKVDRIGLSGTSLKFNDPTKKQQDSQRLDAADHKTAANFLIGWLEEQNGASLAAVLDGKSIETSMGFTATAGLPMMHPLWRSGPGLVSYLACTEQMTATQFQKIVNHESGMLGVSETSSDMRDLLSLEAGDVRAAEAVALFCFQALTIPVFILAAAAESEALTQFRNTKTK